MHIQTSEAWNGGIEKGNSNHRFCLDCIRSASDRSLHSMLAPEDV